ncbi:serine protease [Pseudomonas sp. N-137]|uniref:trypsin-like serine peptidase n=1 Tax=Pseudomonas sp. N-137 TaxID=3108452 RepID=UPI002ADEF84F|nr:serine protease [Pseudomonas sp. N-137]MEA1029372.1 serine protease [Pseudomonas sp. N-137]
MTSSNRISHHAVVHSDKDSRSKNDFDVAIPLPIPLVREDDLRVPDRPVDSGGNAEKTVLVQASEPAPGSIEKVAGTVRPPKKYQFPYHSVGKLLMTAPNGKEYVASGFMITNDLILTAAHCVHTGPGGGGYFKNIRFRPGHPWAAVEVSARTVAVFEKWTVNGKHAYDYAFFKTDYPILLGGTLGITITERGVPSGPRNAEGYPAEPPFDGVSVTEAVSETFWGGNPTKEGWYSMRDNDMTGGSSGGPWINPETVGQVEGLNSFKFEDRPNQMNSPFFGPELRDLYNSIVNS